MSLIKHLQKNNWLKSKEVVKAFEEIKREDFLSENFVTEMKKFYGSNLKDIANLNEALPIGYGQTISQPMVVAFMLELLQVKKGDKVMDIGSGSGWTSALIASITSKKGRVISIEIISELSDFGEKNIAKYGFIKEGIVKSVCSDGNKGFPQESPFDKILTSASIQKKEIPEAWKNQLKIGGRIVVPIENSIWLFIKKNEKDFEKIEYPGFIFVPFVSKEK